MAALPSHKKVAQFGKRVAVIERHKRGDTCVNNGYVPKKVMWYAANIAHAVDEMLQGFTVAVKMGRLKLILITPP